MPVKGLFNDNFASKIFKRINTHDLQMGVVDGVYSTFKY